jgi:hemolysin activation/secretion protein
MKKIAWRLFFLMIMVIALHIGAVELYAAAETVEPSFEIKTFEVIGNTIFPSDKLQDELGPFTGKDKTATDVEKARDALERLYHDAGYPAVMVNIPEQTLKEGVVKLQVIESRIGKVTITGNRYFSTAKLMREMPSLTPHELLYLPSVQKELGRIGRNPDIKVEPVMTPGKEPGTIDVELKVEDQVPLHGYLELNNRSSHSTTELRLNGMLRYDNLWQRDHSLSIQYQTAPQSPKEVQVVGGSYSLPAPWDKDHQIALFGIWSDSDTAFGEGFNVVGKGQIAGMRYVIPLPAYKLYAHNITFGLDFKHFNQTVGFTTESGETTRTPVTYLPLSFSYGAALPDAGGVTQFSAGLNMSFRGVVSNESEFELKRYKATANYFYATAGIQRTQKLPLGMGLFVKLDGQVTDGPLIDNEQYAAGGMESVRGYKETEATGDGAVHGMVELSFPDPFEKTGIGKKFQMSPFIFYDIARLTIRDPLQGQDSGITLAGTGAGLRGSIMKNLEYEVDWAVALDSTDKTRANDQRVYFKLKALL